MARRRFRLLSALYFNKGFLTDLKIKRSSMFVFNQISGRIIDSLNEFNNNSWVIFSIDQKVKTKEFYFPHFSPETFLAELGGSLGLWLGVGAVQILSGVYKILLWTQNNKR